VGEHALDGQVRLARVGRAEHGADALGLIGGSQRRCLSRRDGAAQLSRMNSARVARMRITCRGFDTRWAGGRQRMSVFPPRTQDRSSKVKVGAQRGGGQQAAPDLSQQLCQLGSTSGS
jgi:hypothetical protein